MPDKNSNGSSDHVFGFRTRAFHAGQRPDSATGFRAVPIIADG